jgi:hypothetical protein
MEKVKFTYINRTICPKTGIHFLDAVDTEGQLWSAEMRTDVEMDNLLFFVEKIRTSAL